MASAYGVAWRIIGGGMANDNQQQYNAHRDIINAWRRRRRRRSGAISIGAGDIARRGAWRQARWRRALAAASRRV
jgi:hypothetical protein